MTNKRRTKARIPYRRRPKIGLKATHFFTYLAEDEKAIIDEACDLLRVTKSQFCADAVIARAKQVLASEKRRQARFS
jgi:uncharacterized protein (DUF1778 family)